MKKFIGLAAAVVICTALLLSACASEPAQNALSSPTDLSAPADSAAESGKPTLTSDDALALIEEKLDPEENYSAKVSGSTSVIDNRAVYQVLVFLDDTLLEPTAAVDAATGELFSCHDGQTLGDYSDLPYLTASAKGTDWNGSFLREGDDAKLELRQIDAQSFEFMLESTVSGITSKLNGVAQMGEDGLPQYLGEDGLGLVFELNGASTELTVRVSGDNTAASAEGYTGVYLYQE